MKNLKKFLCIPLLVLLIIGCEDDDNKFSGTPVGVMNIETLKGNIEADVTFALPNQKFNWTVTLPRTFSDTVSVEATSISNSGRRIRAYVDVLPGDLSAIGEMRAAGGGLFETTFDLYLSAIKLQTEEVPGTHYLLESDVTQIATGNNFVPSQNSNRLIVKLVWPEVLATTSNLQLVVERPTLADVNVNTLSSGVDGGRIHNFNVTTSAAGNQNSPTQSSIDGDYYLKIKALQLPTSPYDMPYRLIIVYPNGDNEVFSGVYQGLTLASPFLQVLKVNKSGGNFTVTNLIP